MEACIYGSFVISGVLLGRLYDYSLGRHEYLAGAHIARECNIFMPTMHWSHSYTKQVGLRKTRTGDRFRQAT